MKNLLAIIVITLVCEILIPQSLYAVDNNQQTILITGANRGIGLALVKKFNDQGYLVIATARKPNNATDLQDLKIRIEQLDVTLPASVSKFAERLKGVKIDILINNAGILGKGASKFDSLDIEQISHTFNVNSLGPIRVIQALLPNLRLGNRKLVANISSNMGSISNNSSGGMMGYRASKTALNSFIKSLSIRLARTGFTVVALHPGWVVTGMTNGKGNFSSKESAANLFKVISKLETKDNGKFYNYDGSLLPW